MNISARSLSVLALLCLSSACFQTDPTDISAADAVASDTPPNDSEAPRDSTADEALDIEVEVEPTDTAPGEPDTAPDVTPETACPTPTLTVAEGPEVVPQTLLHLSANVPGTAHDITYAWAVSQPSGSTSALLPASNAPEVAFQADLVGRYVFALTTRVSTAEVSCTPFELEVTVRPAAALYIELLWNAAGDPSAEGGEQGPTIIDETVVTPADTPVTIDPLRNDVPAPGDVLEVVAIREGPSGGLASIGTDGRIAYTPNAEFYGSDRIMVDIGDGHGGSWLERIRILVTAPGNTPPDARDDRFAIPVDTELDLVAVLENDVDVDDDRWGFIDFERPQHGIVVTSGSAAGVTINYVPPAGYVGSDRIRYALDDGRGGMDIATVDILVGDRQPGADLDLHLLDASQSATYFDPRFDAYWHNPNPQWASPATSDDPHLDRDDTDGDGPESISVATPPAGARYCIGVHARDDFGRGASNATLRVYLHGTLSHEQDQRLVRGDLWEAACIDWDSGFVEALVDDSAGPRVTPNYPAPAN